MAVTPLSQQDRPPPVHLSLAPSATGYRPGETVTALLSASTPAPESIELQEVEVEVTGIERVDTSWVLPAYRRDTPALNADRRKVQRLVLQSRLQAAMQGAFADSSLRRFIIRFQLPGWLPPTFRGTAVRYSYWLQARVAYRELAPGELVPPSASHRGPPSLPEGELMPEDLPPDDGADEAAQEPLLGGAGGSTGSKAGGGAAAVTTATVRIPLHIWPLRPESCSSLERIGSLVNGLSSQGASVASTSPRPAQQQQHNPEEAVAIKCWEIGPGTQVQDAISHIAKLAAVPAALRPSSPGKRPASRQHLQPGLQPQANGAAAGHVDDARSEISHDEAEQQQQDSQQKQPVPAAPSAQPSPSLPLPGPGSGSLRRPSLSRAVTADSERSLVTAASAALEGGVTAVRSYALRIGAHPLVRVSLHPPLEGALQPGATVGVTLEFAQPGARCRLQDDGAAAAAAAAGAADGGDRQAPAPRCMQVLVLLETEEAVEAPWRPKGAGGIRRVWDEHSEVTGDTACTHLLFTLPPDAAPSFATPLVQLRWLLRFQFMASTLPAGASPSASPLAGKIDTLSWTLPLAVCSPRS